MRRSFWTGLIVVTLLCSSGGVGNADPENAERSKDTVDDWVLNVSLTDMVINAVPNMAATAFSREGYITGTATLTIKKKGDSDKTDVKTYVKSATMNLKAQAGCQINVENGMSIGSNFTFGAVERGTADTAGGASLGATPGNTIDPKLQGTLKPGYINEKGLELGTKEFTNPAQPKDQMIQTKLIDEGLVRVISLQDVHVKVDGCGGPVFVRLHAQVLMSTNHSYDTVDVYSDIVPL